MTAHPLSTDVGPPWLQEHRRPWWPAAVCDHSEERLALGAWPRDWAPPFRRGEDNGGRGAAVVVELIDERFEAREALGHDAQHVVALTRDTMVLKDPGLGCRLRGDLVGLTAPVAGDMDESLHPVADRRRVDACTVPEDDAAFFESAHAAGNRRGRQMNHATQFTETKPGVLLQRGEELPIDVI